MTYSNLERMGIPVVKLPVPHVRWKDLRRRLGQWRYGFAYRLGPLYESARGGPHAADADRIIGAMAVECHDDWRWGPL